jgi:flagellar hook-associated protein 3 FlgL
VNIGVSDLTQANNAISYIDQQSTSLAQVQNDIETGLQVNVPSDNPVAFVQISQVQAASDQLTAYTQNISNATSTLNQSVSTLTDVNNLLTQAQQLAAQGANGIDSSNQTDLSALGTQVNGLITEALTDANSQFQGQSLYAGTATTTTPFTVATTNTSGEPETVTYNGSAQNTSTIVGQGQTVSTQYAGSNVFQQSGSDVFQALIGLRENLQNTSLSGTQMSQALNQSISQITSAQTAIQGVIGQQSSDLSTLSTLSTTTSNAQLADQTQQGNLQSTNYASAVVQMQQDETALQAIYATTAQMLQPGFLDFLQEAQSTS